MSVFLAAANHAGQDPMRPPHLSSPSGSKAVKVEPIRLQQILISKNRKIVIINDKILQEGQSIAGAKITRIETYQVRIRRAGVNEIIKLLPATKDVNREI